MCTVLSVGFGLPHQPATAAKSYDFSGVCAASLNAPVPTSVSVFFHQLSKSALTTFWSTIMPATDGCAMAEGNHPAAPESLTTTVWSSSAVKPDSVTEGSCLSSRAWSAAPATRLVETLSYPLIADRLAAYGPCIAAARFHE